MNEWLELRSLLGPSSVWLGSGRKGGKARQLATNMRRSPFGLERQLLPEPAVRTARSRLAATRPTIRRSTTFALIPKADICSRRRECPNLGGYRTAAVSDGLVQPSRSILQRQRVWSLVSDHSPDDAVERLARSGIRDQFLAMMREKDLGQFC